MVKWIITKWQHEWIDTRLKILVWTDKPIHAFIHYSLSEEIFAVLGSQRRGIRRLQKPLWELANLVALEQNVRGDTDCHIFYLPAIPPEATLTFFITAEQEGVLAKSVSVPIKIQHPNQDEADPINPGDEVDCGAFDPWTQNQKDAVAIHDDCWNIAGMTGSAYFNTTQNRLILSIGATPGSIAQIYTENIFDLTLDHTLHSQLRAIVSFPSLSADINVFILHGYFYGAISSYGFWIGPYGLYGRSSNSTGAASILLRTININTPYLLEAKHHPSEKIDFWVNGDHLGTITTYLPDSAGLGFFTRIHDTITPYAAIHFRRFMIWKQSIWTS